MRRYYLTRPCSKNDMVKRLDVLAHHGNHQVEQTHGLDESETQNGVGEELATESRVAGDGHQQSGEDETDTDTGTTETDGGGTHTQVLGDLNHGGGDLRGVLTAGSGLEGVAGVGLEEGRGGALGGGESSDGGLLGGEGALGGSVQLEAGGRASDLGGLGHGGSQTASEDTGSGHCDEFGEEFGGWLEKREECGIERNFSRRKKLGNYGRRPVWDINTPRHNFRPSASRSRLVRA